MSVMHTADKDYPLGTINLVWEGQLIVPKGNRTASLHRGRGTRVGSGRVRKALAGGMLTVCFPFGRSEVQGVGRGACDVRGVPDGQ